MKAKPKRVQKWDTQREGQRVVLLDLDGTLIKSEEARRDAWNRALPELRSLFPEPFDIDHVLAAYGAIYTCHNGLTDKRGPRGHIFEDMRQEWNTRTSYALLIAWHEKFSLGQLRMSGDYVDRFRQILDPASVDLPLLLSMAEEIRDPWSIPYTDAIDRAVAAFWTGNWKTHVYPGVVPELLRSLRREGIEYCIATEGHLPTQWRKICAVGLNKKDPKTQVPWIREQQLLATSQAAQPRRELDALNALSEWNLGQASAHELAANSLTFAKNSVEDSRVEDVRSKLYSRADAATLTSKGLKRIAQLFRRLALKLYQEGRIQPAFYLRVIYALNQGFKDARNQFLGFRLGWHPTPIRLAMIGDNFESDVLPIVVLAMREIRILSIWLRKQGHGDKEEGKALLNELGDLAGLYENRGRDHYWHECGTIPDAVKRHLLDSATWLEETKCLTQPKDFFGSAVEPDLKVGETLDKNLDELIAGIAAVKTEHRQSPTDAANALIVHSLNTFMDEDWFKTWFRIMISDILAGNSWHDVIEKLIAMCTNPVQRTNKPVFACEGSQRATVELLLSLLTQDTVKPRSTRGYPDPICSLVCLLRVDKDAKRGDPHWEWISALVVAIGTRGGNVIEHICASPCLGKYVDNLVFIIEHASLPHGFPKGEAIDLFARLKSCPQQPVQPSSLQETSVAGRARQAEIRLGQTSPSIRAELQQSVYLGKDVGSDKDVRCLLGGPGSPGSANIVCICGRTKTGKSTTIGALVKGALEGEGEAGSTAARSAVMVFNQDEDGAKRFLTLCDCPVDLIVNDNEVETAKRKYSATKNPRLRVLPLRFRLDQLEGDVMIRWVGLDGKAGAAAFGDIFKELKDAGTLTFDTLVDRVAAASFSGKNHVLKNLEDRVKPQLGDVSIRDELAPGRVTVVDWGRQAAKSEQLSTWERILSLMTDETQPRSDSEQYLLVFDEVRQVFGSAATKSKQKEVQRLASRRLETIALKGRHLHTSVIAVSQTPDHFKGIDPVMENATVLLFHNLQKLPRQFEHLPLWKLAVTSRDMFSSLRVGEAWYASRENKEASTGRVQIPRP